MSADDAKLTALREAERKAKAEAETGLHEYRGTLTEEEKKLLAMKEEERKQRTSTLHGSQAELVTPSKDMDPSFCQMPSLPDQAEPENPIHSSRQSGFPNH